MHNDITNNTFVTYIYNYWISDCSMVAINTRYDEKAQLLLQCFINKCNAIQPVGTYAQKKSLKVSKHVRQNERLENENERRAPLISNIIISITLSGYLSYHIIV